MKLKTLFSAGMAIRVTTLVFAQAGAATAAQADPQSTYDADMSAIQFMKDCKMDISDLEKKYPRSGPKLQAMGDAAWRQLWTKLDAQDSAHHDENGRKANFELNKRVETDWVQAHSQVAAKGCDALVPDARAVMERSLQ